MTAASLTAVLAAAFALGDSAAEQERAKQVVARERVQATLVFEDLETNDPTLDWELRGFRIPFSLSAPGLVDVGQMILYVGLAALLVVALLAIARSIARRRRGAIAVTQAALRAAAGEGIDRPADELFAEADQLAAEARWEEAVHALLLAAIRVLSDEFGPPRKSRTSRELISHFRLEGDRRTAFQRLVGVVERVYFGGLQANEDMFRNWRALAVGLRGAPA